MSRQSRGFFAFCDGLVRTSLTSLLLLFLPVLCERSTKDVLSTHNTKPDKHIVISEMYLHVISEQKVSRL